MRRTAISSVRSPVSGRALPLPPPIKPAFFYFKARPESGDSVYLNGLHEARAGKEIMDFEFP